MFVEDYLSLKITPVRQLAKKIGISETTAFAWRHRLLSALQNKPVQFKDETLEFDEGWHLISRKGRQGMNLGNKGTIKRWRKNKVGDSPYYCKMLYTYGRESHKLELHLSHMGKTTKKHLEAYFIPGKVENVKLYTDKHVSYKGYFADNRIEHKDFKASHHRAWEDKTVHVQSINAFSRDFGDFVNRSLRGVSTKYLGNYASLFMFLHDAKMQVDQKLNAGDKIKFDTSTNICKEITGDNVGLERFRSSELRFLGFLL